MKNIFLRLTLVIALCTGFVSCVEDDYDIGEITAPTNLEVDAEIVGQSEDMPNGDGSGQVNFSASANGAMTYKFIYGDGFSDVAADGNVSHPFNKNGVNDYLITVIAYGPGGTSTSETVTVTVFSNFSDPETKQLLTGGDTKTWYVAAAQAGHLGVGPSNGDGYDSPIYYAATPFEKAGEDVSACFYTDVLTFSLDSNDNIIYNQDNNGATFYNVDYTDGAGEDQCRDLDTSGDRMASLAPGTSGIPTSTGTAINFTEGGFMSYFIGTSTYEILEITENSMYVRAIPGSNPALAWYLKFTTTPYDEQGSGGDGDDEFETEFENQIWEATFDDETSLDTSVWNYEIGNGDNGWGNGEAQYYTEANTSIVDGNLLITAKRESESGFDFTSSRITTQDNFEFTYGRVEARAKLPEGGGTWPAIWMLGNNFDEVGWPATGEIDIMEHKGNEPGVIHGSLHYPGASGGDADTNTTTIENPSSEFHTYTMEWSSERIVFLVDSEVYHTYENTPDSAFNKDFFLILNVAMGGTFGGDIDPAFQESSMEIDYIRVYQ
ncbi:MAG: glycoside hydrolase family 16 protein [Christiangramia sp.]|nr:glycoside hydrolase family 16 protein [Christiangramia sp.]